MNLIGAAAVVFSVVAFAATHKLLRPRPIPVRVLFLCAFALLAVPSLWFAIYYLHVLRDYEWFYALRSWPGSEFLAVFLGCAGGAAASLLPRLLHGVALFAMLAPAVLPYIKPLIGPLADDVFRERS